MLLPRKLLSCLKPEGNKNPTAMTHCQEDAVVWTFISIPSLVTFSSHCLKNEKLTTLIYILIKPDFSSVKKKNAVFESSPLKSFKQIHLKVLVNSRSTFPVTSGMELPEGYRNFSSFAHTACWATQPHGCYHLLSQPFRSGH